MVKEYIERETAVAFLENMAASKYLIQCFESKEKFPAADVVEVRHGVWIEHTTGIITCSECNNGEYLEDKKRLKYCPICGTKMDGGKKQ